MEIPFIQEPVEEIGVPSGKEGGPEKGIGFQERFACKFLISFGSAYRPKKRRSPIHHSEEEIGARGRIGKGIEAVCKVNPESLYMRGKSFKDLGLRAGLPPALLAIVDPVPQINPIVLPGVKEAPGYAAILVQVAQGPAAETSDGERRSIPSDERIGVLSENSFYDISMSCVLVTGGSDGGTAGKTGLHAVRKAESADTQIIRHFS
jgi:hypothetical protein